MINQDRLVRDIILVGASMPRTAIRDDHVDAIMRVSDIASAIPALGVGEVLASATR